MRCGLGITGRRHPRGLIGLSHRVPLTRTRCVDLDGTKRGWSKGSKFLEPGLKLDGVALSAGWVVVGHDALVIVRVLSRVHLLLCPRRAAAVGVGVEWEVCVGIRGMLFHGNARATRYCAILKVSR